VPLKAILLNPSLGIHNSNIDSPILKSIDGNGTIDFTSRAHLYVQLSPLLLFDNQNCFQLDLSSSKFTRQIQFIYKSENIKSNTVPLLG
jgi:hypothetical protein